MGEILKSLRQLEDRDQRLAAALKEAVGRCTLCWKLPKPEKCRKCRDALALVAEVEGKRHAPHCERYGGGHRSEADCNCSAAEVEGEGQSG